jgi:hypothetical protein
LKHEPIKTIGVTALGLIDTSLIGMATDYACDQTGKCAEWQKDTVRLVTKLGVGTALSYGVDKAANSFGRYHQIGVYIGTGLDIIGTVIKYGRRNWKVSGIGYQIPMTPMNTVGKIFGLGSILTAVGEAKVARSLEQGGLIVARGDNGDMALATTGGEIVVSGPAKSMVPVPSPTISVSTR